MGEICYYNIVGIDCQTFMSFKVILVSATVKDKYLDKHIHLNFHKTVEIVLVYVTLHHQRCNLQVFILVYTY